MWESEGFRSVDAEYAEGTVQTVSEAEEGEGGSAGQIDFDEWTDAECVCESVGAVEGGECAGFGRGVEGARAIARQ